VASWAFLARVQAENGLPIEPYIAVVAADGSPSSQRSPDFGGHPGSTTREIELNRPFWVWPEADFEGCGNVLAGAEYVTEFTEERFLRHVSTATVCVGRATLTLSSLGEAGGGFRFSTTNGCSCEVPSVPTSDVGGSVLLGYGPGETSAACPDGTAYRRGSYVRTST
jgi:hypothetical protein